MDMESGSEDAEPETLEEEKGGSKGSGEQRPFDDVTVRGLDLYGTQNMKGRSI
jgi:hypothetical protein